MNDEDRLQELASKCDMIRSELNKKYELLEKNGCEGITYQEYQEKMLEYEESASEYCGLHQKILE